MTNMRKLAIISSGTLTGLIGALMKLMGDRIPVLSIVFLRFFLATLFLLIVMSFIDRRFYAVTKSDVKSYSLIGLTMAVAFSLFMLALSYSTISNVVLIASTYIIFVAILASMFLNERLKNKHYVSMFIAFIGLLILNPFGGTMNVIGSSLAFAQAIVYSIFMVYMRHEGQEHSLSSVFWIFLFATLYLTPFAFYYGLGSYYEVLPLVFLLGIISTGLAYLLLIYGLRRVRAETSAILMFTSHTFSSIFFAVLLIGEVLSTKMIIGGVLLIFSGIYIIYSKKIRHYLHHH